MANGNTVIVIKYTDIAYTCILVCLQVSSLGSGHDHVMDAISECEQVVRGKGKLKLLLRFCSKIDVKLVYNDFSIISINIKTMTKSS